MVAGARLGGAHTPGLRRALIPVAATSMGE